MGIFFWMEISIKIFKCMNNVNPYPNKLIYLNFQPLEVVSRYRDSQPQVSENYSYLFNPFKPEFTIVIFLH